MSGEPVHDSTRERTGNLSKRRAEAEAFFKRVFGVQFGVDSAQRVSWRPRQQIVTPNAHTDTTQKAGKVRLE